MRSDPKTESILECTTRAVLNCFDLWIACGRVPPEQAVRHFGIQGMADYWTRLFIDYDPTTMDLAATVIARRTGTAPYPWPSIMEFASAIKDERADFAIKALDDQKYDHAPEPVAPPTLPRPVSK